MCARMDVTRRTFLASAGTAASVFAARTPLARASELAPGSNPLGLDNIRDGILYVPRGYKAGVPTPLVVVFHGAGSSGANCQYAFPMADEYGFLILAPDSRSELTWDLVLGSYGPDVEFLQKAFQQTLARCTVDRQRLSIAGHSDGASYALSFGIGVGDLFGHLIALSPGVMTPVDAKGKPRIFISHGISDRTMPIDDTSRKFVPRLRGLGYDVTYREYDGGHGAPAPLVHDAFEWMVN
jgi:phospholipase/carboxylesterase